MLGRARRYLGQPEAALADLERGAARAAGTGRERVSLILTLESVAALVALGRLEEAAAAGEEGLELARLSQPAAHDAVGPQRALERAAGGGRRERARSRTPTRPRRSGSKATSTPRASPAGVSAPP